MSRKRCREEVDTLAVSPHTEPIEEVQNDQEEEKVVRDDDVDALLDKSDVELVMDSVLSIAPNMPFVFQHLVEQRLSDNLVILEEQLQQLRSRRVVKVLFTEDLLSQSHAALVYTERYLRDIERAIVDAKQDPLMDSALRKLHGLLCDSDNITLSRSDLHSVRLTDKEIDQLVASRFLRYRHASGSTEQLYWLCHPLVGIVASAFRAVEKKILPSIKRMKYKELSTKQIAKMSLGSSLLPWEIHLLNLQARGLVKKIVVPSATVGFAPDYVLRLP